MSKVAIITGSSRGIGRAIALQLANDGFNITINYRNSLSEANKLLNEIKMTKVNKGVLRVFQLYSYFFICGGGGNRTHVQ